uniref:EGF-like domain-containing protein n=1 Tax=Fundulus heteroclitus TaxID=8078 RepID=A0A3Q2QDA9_FUNHE
MLHSKELHVTAETDLFLEHFDWLYRCTWEERGTVMFVRSEVFKPCVEDKDLAFCLNEGECSIIETVAGVHRHCRCKEGYHGLRCDQFVPKSDAILSDPSTRCGQQGKLLLFLTLRS